MVSLFKIPPTYAAFVENFPVIEYLPAEAIDLKAGKQTDGGWVIYVELCQYIRANIDSVLNYVPSDLGLRFSLLWIISTRLASLSSVLRKHRPMF